MRNERRLPEPRRCFSVRNWKRRKERLKKKGRNDGGIVEESSQPVAAMKTRLDNCAREQLTRTWPALGDRSDLSELHRHVTVFSDCCGLFIYSY